MCATLLSLTIMEIGWSLHIASAESWNQLQSSQVQPYNWSVKAPKGFQDPVCEWH